MSSSISGGGAGWVVCSWAGGQSRATLCAQGVLQAPCDTPTPAQQCSLAVVLQHVLHSEDVLQHQAGHVPAQLPNPALLAHASHPLLHCAVPPPHTLCLTQGRQLLYGWMQEHRRVPTPPALCEEFSYAGCISTPRVLQLVEGQLWQMPLPEINSLRTRWAGAHGADCHPRGLLSRQVAAGAV